MLCTFLMHRKTPLSTDCGNLLQQPVSLTFDSQSQNNFGCGNSVNNGCIHLKLDRSQLNLLVLALRG
ncbi:Uncharacterized protein HZ326_5057 [Fusarium oxysporum f. sp. albedinis]|nr:Uncharacterized protein HZ326_5057 [Fusarium oxysporum f. sp. albedinis]